LVLNKYQRFDAQVKKEFRPFLAGIVRLRRGRLFQRELRGE